jgi:hypothetical protein
VNQGPDAILRDNLRIAERMLSHLQRSYDQVAADLPLNPAGVNALSHEQIDRLDLYLARFGKLQDFLVSKLFRSVAMASLEDTSQDVSLIDSLRRMEKYGIVTSLDRWLELRLLRSSLTHEYLTTDEEIAENINTAFSYYSDLAATLGRVKDYSNKHIYQDH